MIVIFIKIHYFYFLDYFYYEILIIFNWIQLKDFKFIEVILWKLFYVLLAVLQQPKPLS